MLFPLVETNCNLVVETICLPLDKSGRGSSLVWKDGERLWTGNGPMVVVDVVCVCTVGHKGRGNVFVLTEKGRVLNFERVSSTEVI